MKEYTYLTCCVNSTAAAIDAMVDAATEVTYATARRHIADLDKWAGEQGYDTGSERGGLRLKDDWHVGYYKSVYRGRPCYYIRHSCIEHIFVKGN